MNIIDTKLSFNGTLAKRDVTTTIVLHHAAAKTCSIDDIHKWHLNNGWSGCGYHFLVRKDGSIYKGRTIDTIGAHAQGSNSFTIGICAEGDYDNELMSDVQFNSIVKLCKYLNNYYKTKLTIVKHSDLCSTDCPGKYYPYDSIVEAVIKEDEVMIYNYIDENMPEWARAAVQFMVEQGVVEGDGNGLGLTESDLRHLTWLYRIIMLNKI